MTSLLNDFPNLRRLESRGHLGIKYGLDQPRAMLQAMGHPEASFPCVLIAGTNGKGSTGAFMAHALKQCGLTVGWTTSPHLLSPTERIWLDGASIRPEALDLVLEEVFECEKRLGIQATYFELMIVSAMLAFRMAGVEMALVEVGMGGRWDATNALDPVVTVLTNVGMDHTQYLGHTLEAIGKEKLCTARDDRPLVIGPRLDTQWVERLLECNPRICPVTVLAPEAIEWDASLVRGHRIGLPGAHQMENLATALEGLHQLAELGFPIDDKAVWAGLSQTQWPGRLWKAPGLDKVWMDGAHNPDGAWTLARHVRRCQIKPHLYFGAMGDKDLAPMAKALQSMHPASITLIRGENERYATHTQLQSLWGELPVLTIPEAVQALKGPSQDIRLVTGSLYMIGDLLKEMGVEL